MIVNNLLRASRASCFLPKAHRYLPSVILGQMIRNRRKVIVVVNLEKKLCSDRILAACASAGPRFPFQTFERAATASRHGRQRGARVSSGLDIHRSDALGYTTLGEDRPMHGGTENEFSRPSIL